VAAAVGAPAAYERVARPAALPGESVRDDRETALVADDRVLRDAAEQAEFLAAAMAIPNVAPFGAPVGDAVIAPPPLTFDEHPAPPEEPPPPLRHPGFDGITPEGGVWAVVIGINDYPGSRSDLRSAVNDAGDVREALLHYGVPAHRVLTILDRQATPEVILAAADWLVAHSAPDATAVFFYAGHVRKVSAGREVIVAADGRLVTDAALGDRLRPLAARQAWISLAACYGGGFTELLAPGRVLTAAAGPNSLAYENLGFQRSYLVQYMVRMAMIEDRAPATVQDAYRFAVDALRRDYPNRVPYQIDHGGGPVMFLPEPYAAPPPSGGSAPPPREDPPSAGSPGGEPAPPPEDEEDQCIVTIGSVIGCG
jgi:hypothetical protein